MWNYWFEWIFDRWWAVSLFSLLLFFNAYLGYNTGREIDSGEQDIRYVMRSTRVLYKAGGTFLVTAVPTTIGLACLGVGAYMAIRKYRFNPTV